jgi:hypothetical protein
MQYTSFGSQLYKAAAAVKRTVLGVAGIILVQNVRFEDLHAIFDSARKTFGVELSSEPIIHPIM